MWVEDYLLTYPIVPPKVPQTYAHWSQRMVIPFEHANGLLVLHAGSIYDKQQQRLAFLQDFGFRCVGHLFGELANALARAVKRGRPSPVALVERKGIELCMDDERLFNALGVNFPLVQLIGNHMTHQGEPTMTALHFCCGDE